MGRGWVLAGSWISVDYLEEIMVGGVHMHIMTHLVRPKVEMKNRFLALGGKTLFVGSGKEPGSVLSQSLWKVGLMSSQLPC